MARKAAIIGGGVIGGGWAARFLLNGWDVVVFDPARIEDHATFASPHQYATGVSDVLVGGAAVLRGGVLTLIDRCGARRVL